MEKALIGGVKKVVGYQLHFCGKFSKSTDSQTHSAPRLISLRSTKRGSDRGFAPILAGAPLEIIDVFVSQKAIL